MNKKTVISIAVTAIIMGGLVWIARPTSQNSAASLLTSTKSGGILNVAETKDYDCGAISMAVGKVTRKFKIKNTSPEPVIIEKIYTSCMCTEAMLIKNEEHFGPYGMPGHGFIPKINQVINKNEEATVEVIFDPAAHGPAGVGKIQRIVTVGNTAGEPLQLSFTATVTP